MKAPFSPYLSEIAPGLKRLVSLLRRRYDYVSVLSTDSRGFAVSISQKAKSVRNETMTTERAPPCSPIGWNSPVTASING